MTATTKLPSFFVWSVLIISTVTFFVCFLSGVFPKKKCQDDELNNLVVFCKRKAMTTFVDNYMNHYEDQIKTKHIGDQKSQISKLFDKISYDTKACFLENIGYCLDEEIATKKQKFEEEHNSDFVSFCDS